MELNGVDILAKQAKAAAADKANAKSCVFATAAHTIAVTKFQAHRWHFLLAF